MREGNKCAQEIKKKNAKKLVRKNETKKEAMHDFLLSGVFYLISCVVFIACLDRGRLGLENLIYIFQ